MLITGAVLLDGTTVDIRTDQTILAVGPGLSAEADEEVFDADGATVLPGLHDHHVHLRSAAAALTSAPAGPPAVATAADLRAALRDAPVDADGWIRAVGYHDSVAGPLDRQLLDTLSGPTPVRVQHRSGAMWTLNSAALARIGASGHPDGRFFRSDPAEPRPRPPALAEVSARLAAVGVTGVTDATPGYSQRDLAAFDAARSAGEVSQRLHCMAVAGTRATGQVSVGGAKIILDDTTLDYEALLRWVTDNHAVDHPVAIHAVTDAQLVVAVAALREAGRRTGDRIEHAAVVPEDCIADLVELGATVVTQPNFVAERGDEYRAGIPTSRHHQLWRVASLCAAGVPVAFSTDTPFGVGDPWAAMRAAVHRRTRRGAVLGVSEAVSPQQALTMFLGWPERPDLPRRVAAGQPGDLCVLDASPRRVLAELDAGLVAATVIGGRVVTG